MATLIVISLLVVGLLGALGTAIRVSDVAWRASRSTIEATTAAEDVLALAYVPCTSGNVGTAGPATSYRNQLTAPAGFTVAVSGTYLTDTALPANATTPASTSFATCGSKDLGAQQLTVTLSRVGSTTVVRRVTVVKRNDTCSAKALLRVGHLAGQRC